MLISGNNNLSYLKNCLEAAPNFLLSEDEASAIIEEQKFLIEQNWDLVCQEAQLSDVDKKYLWRRQF